MTVVRHRSAPAAPADRGREFGRAQSERVALVADVYARLFAILAGLDAAAVRRLGGAALERIAATAPDLAAEIEGIAAGSGLPVETVAALNARTELLRSAAGECSAIACAGEAAAAGAPFGIQTWDWHEELRDGWLVWTIDHPDGRRVETLTEAGIVGKIGLNDAGVGVLLNILSHAGDGGPMGDPVHVLCRRVLDEAAGAGEAFELLRGARPSASSAVTVVAADDVGVVELSPAGPGSVSTTDGVVAHTNHFLAAPGRDGEGTTDSTTRPRLQQARAAARAQEGGLRAAAVLEAIAGHDHGDGSICCHPVAGAALGERWTTLATVVLEPAAGRMRVLRGGPCQAEAASTTAAAARQ